MGDTTKTTTSQKFKGVIMAQRKPKLIIGQVTAQTSGEHRISIGTGADVRNVPANHHYEDGDEVLTCWIDDDSPVIIGRPGYTVER